MAKTAEKKEDPIEKLKEGIKGAPQNTATGRRYGKRLVRATQPKKGK